ncbi:hypothetical protein DPMN_036229 [Dreissena polymorpha]|uniref:Uncharacterized protein n=1 Tax=Dreissena polymorpha TaxID=45954 RepID=A0A9D4M922_DREPO|nr:hypothetical protein DPMN_036229 [Dreissena polymorpha]
MNFFIFALCARPDDEHKAVLDKGKLDLLIDYDIEWGRIVDLNNTVIERNSYSRKQFKKRIQCERILVYAICLTLFLIYERILLVGTD